MKKSMVILCAVLLVFAAGMANAALIEIGTATYSGSNYKLIYEDTQALVWLDYTKNWDTWQNQVNWASAIGGNLTVNLDPGYTTTIDWSTGWRLPSTDESKANLSGGFGYQGPDQNGNYNYAWGYNMANSEMGHLFYESLGNKGYRAPDGTIPQPGFGLQNTGPFANLQAERYWSGTEFSPNPDVTWCFGFHDGALSLDAKHYYTYALAVRPGEVSAVPVPGTMLLLAAGLAGLGACWKRIGRRRG